MNTYVDDFLQMINEAASAEDIEGRSFYTPGYGGWGASELKSNSYQNFLSNFMNYSIMRETNANNRELAKMQNAWNRKQWEDTNAYNTPAQQVQRFKEAGFSSSAAAQAAQGFPSSPMQSADLATDQTGSPMTPAHGDPNASFMAVLNSIGSVLQFSRQFQQLRLDKVAADKAEVTKESDINGILTANDAKRWALRQTIQQFEYDLKANPYKLHQEWNKSRASEYLPEQEHLALMYAKQNYDLAKQRFGFLEKMNEAELKKMTEEISNVLKEREEIASRIQVNKATSSNLAATTENINADTENKKAQKEGFEAESVTKRLQSILVKHGSPDSVAQRLAALLTEKEIDVKQLSDDFDSTIDYLRRGYESFGKTGDDNLIDFFNYFGDPGAKETMNKGVYSIGGILGLKRLFNKWRDK